MTPPQSTGLSLPSSKRNLGLSAAGLGNTEDPPEVEEENTNEVTFLEEEVDT